MNSIWLRTAMCISISVFIGFHAALISNEF